jgi:hypothetical protein
MDDGSGTGMDTFTLCQQGQCLLGQCLLGQVDVGKNAAYK